MKKRGWRNLFVALGLVLSHLACAHVSYAYCNSWWLGKTALTSAPPTVAFLFLIPYGAGVLICTVLAIGFHLSAKRG